MTDKYSIGVDPGGTNLRIAAYAGGTAFLETITYRLWAGRHGERKLIGIAVGTPRPLELPAGILRNLPNFPGWDGFHLKAAISGTLGREIVLENDANLAAFAEQQVGAGSAHVVEGSVCHHAWYGCGKRIDFERQDIGGGANGFAGEAGRMIVRNADELTCGCGRRGCLEQYGSATGSCGWRVSVSEFAHLRPLKSWPCQLAPKSSSGH